MTEPEQHRSNEQRRVAEIVAATEKEKMSVRIQLLGIIVVVGGAIAGLVLNMAKNVARDEIAPVDKRLSISEVKLEVMEKNLEDFKGGQKEMLLLIREIYKDKK